MKIAILTSNAIRHRYFANTLAAAADEALVICECVPSDAAVFGPEAGPSSPVADHFRERQRTEGESFAGNDRFRHPTIPLMYKEANLASTCETIRRFNADAVFVYGASLIKEPLLSIPPRDRFINLHLGLSPYYRGAGTNFWPFVNGELEYVGATLLHIDAGVDTGDIIAHVRPEFEPGDTVHTAGCKVIRAATATCVEIIRRLRENRPLNRIRQWKIPNERYYRKRDFNEAILMRYRQNLADGLVKRYLQSPRKELRLIAL